MNVKDFSKCHFNPLDPDFPTKSKRLMDVSNNVPLMKFIITMYDPHSPVRIAYPEMGQRRAECGSLVGYKTNKDITELEAVAAFEYLKIINNRLWSSMVVIEQSIWEYSKLMLQPMKPVDTAEKTDKEILAEMNLKKNLSATLVDLNNQFEELSVKFYGDTEVEREIQANIEDFSPESIAKILRGL